MLRSVLGSSLSALSLGPAMLEIAKRDHAQVRGLEHALEAFSLAGTERYRGGDPLTLVKPISSNGSTVREYTVFQEGDTIRVEKRKLRDNILIEGSDAVIHLNRSDRIISSSTMSHWKSAAHLHAVTVLIKEEIEKSLKDPQRDKQMFRAFARELLDRARPGEAPIGEKNSALRALDVETFGHLINDHYQERSAVFSHSQMVTAMVHDAHTGYGRTVLLFEVANAVKEMNGALGGVSGAATLP